MEYSLEQIKDLYCKFSCSVKYSIPEDKCRNCDVSNICDKLDICCAKEKQGVCQLCQVDKFILELKDQKVISQ